MTERVQTQIDAQGTLHVTLNRPDRRNAFDESMARMLVDTFQQASLNPAVRVVVLGGAGPVFCAGGDIEWMRRNGQADQATRLEQATLISDLFDSIDRCSKPTIAVVQGAAMGGGVGLLACSDFVIATTDCQIGTSEARLGIVPACLAPYLLSKIGVSHTRRLFLSAARITGAEAHRIGLVHELVETQGQLHTASNSLLCGLQEISPRAQSVAKTLLREIIHHDEESFRTTRQNTIQTLVDSWGSESGQEGMAAFLEQRPPRWNTTSSS